MEDTDLSRDLKENLWDLRARRLQWEGDAVVSVGMK